MRFCLNLELIEPCFPVEYRSLIISYIKNAITKCNGGKYYDKYFKDTIEKDYCFSVVLPKSKFNKNIIELENNEIKINFSTGDKNKTGLILFNAFIAQKNKPYPLPNNNLMVLKSINNKKQEKITSSRAIFKTSLGSGLCVREHKKEGNKDDYYIYSDNKFREKLKVVLVNQALKAGFTESEANKVKVNPIQCKKVVAKHYKRYIDITTGMFEIQGNNEILQHFYNVGMGSRKSSGFGMLDLVTQDLQ